IVDLFGRLRSDARYLDHLRKPERNFLFQFFVKLDATVSNVFLYFAGEVSTDTGDVAQRAVHSQRLNIVCESLDIDRSATIGADTKWVRPLDLEKIGNLIKDKCYFQVAHAVVISFSRP